MNAAIGIKGLASKGRIPAWPISRCLIDRSRQHPECHVGRRAEKWSLWTVSAYQAGSAPIRPQGLSSGSRALRSGEWIQDAFCGKNVDLAFAALFKETSHSSASPKPMRLDHLQRIRIGRQW